MAVLEQSLSDRLNSISDVVDEDDIVFDINRVLVGLRSARGGYELVVSAQFGVWNLFAMWTSL
jgi:hypothetical protein